MYRNTHKNTFLHKSVCFINFYAFSKLLGKLFIGYNVYAYFINVLSRLCLFSKKSSVASLSYKRGKYLYFSNCSLFNYLKLDQFFFLESFVYFIFFIFKKNVYSLFRLRQSMSLNLLSLSFKGVLGSVISNSLKSQPVYSWFSEVGMFLKKNNLNLLRHTVNHKQYAFVQKLLPIGLLSINMFYSFFHLWNFLLFTPHLNFLTLNPSASFNFSHSVRIWESFFKSKVSVYKYLNISSFDNLLSTHVKLLKFRKLKYKLLRFIEDSLFSDVLVRLTESVGNCKTIISINKSLREQLTVYELAKLDILKRRLQNSIQSRFWRLNTKFIQNKTRSFRHFYRRGFSFFWHEITLVCFLMYKSRDTSMLMTYIRKKMRFMNLFSHKFFLKKLWLVLNLLFFETRSVYFIYGIKVKISGKLSVTGNSRTRTKVFKNGIISYSNMNTRADYSFSIIKTKTGCLGFSLWLFF